MKTLQTRAHNGRTVLDDPCDCPEGAVVDLVLADDGDDLGPEERGALDASLSRSWEQAKADQTRPAETMLEELRARS